MKQFIIEHQDFGSLIEVLKRRGYTVIGPTVKDGAIIFDELTSVTQLPIGWTDEQTNGSYRLQHQNNQKLFGFSVGPQSVKKYLFPPVQKIFATHRNNTNINLPGTNSSEEQKKKYAFLGIHPCDLAAIRIQDKIFLEGEVIDPVYKHRRSDAFIVVVNCTQPGQTCFCASMQSGPRATEGFDLAVTEIINNQRHYFLMDVGSDIGGDILRSVKNVKASDEEISTARQMCENALAHMGRNLDTKDLKELLYKNSEHHRWEKTALRCLTCANCTMVCPTCFCANVEDVTDLSGASADRIRKWDSCFTLEFSYIHGGAVRASAKARYRQWMMHKLASWVDQFGSFGCVGCGRCITWCPVGIDITEEASAIRENGA